jgi:hypothetical protein
MMQTKGNTEMTRKYEFTATEARDIHKLLDGHIKALHNWIASHVEAGNVPAAQKLVTELRTYQRYFARTNVEAHEIIDSIR